MVLHYNLTTASNLRGLASGHQPLTIHLSCTLTNVFTLQPHFNPCPSPQVQHRAPLPTLSKLQAFALGPGLSHLTAPWPLGGGASGGGGWEAGDWPWGDKDPFGLMLVRGVRGGEGVRGVKEREADKDPFGLMLMRGEGGEGARGKGGKGGGGLGGGGLALRGIPLASCW